MKKTPKIISMFLLIIIILSACNLPSKKPDSGGSSAAVTAAAQTVAAQLTAIAPIYTATNLPIVSFTSTPISSVPATSTPIIPTLPPPATATSNCNAMQFVTDVTIPDGTVMTQGQAFTKTWRLKNIGTCTWTTSYAIVFSSGNSLNGPATQTLTGNVNPGQTVDISVSLTAPGTNGDYTGYWKLRDGAGVLFNGSGFYAQIKVQSAIFAVTAVSYSVTTWSSGGSVNCPRITANITTNGPGSVDYHWTRSDNAGSSTATLVFGSAGTQSVTSDWQLGSVWAGGADEWMGIYIDAPNHQDFGHAVMPACTSP